MTRQKGSTRPRGRTDSGLTPPSPGNTSCTSNGNACVYNSSDNHYQIGLRIPQEAARINWNGGTNAFCWPVPLGDQEPLQGGSSWSGARGSGIDVSATDRAGQHMGHCVQGAPNNNYWVKCILTSGTDFDSATDYGIVCMK